MLLERTKSILKLYLVANICNSTLRLIQPLEMTKFPLQHTISPARSIFGKTCHWLLAVDTSSNTKLIPPALKVLLTSSIVYFSLLSSLRLITLATRAHSKCHAKYYSQNQYPHHLLTSCNAWIGDPTVGTSLRGFINLVLARFTGFQCHNQVISFHTLNISSTERQKNHFNDIPQHLIRKR